MTTYFSISTAKIVTPYYLYLQDLSRCTCYMEKSIERGWPRISTRRRHYYMGFKQFTVVKWWTSQWDESLFIDWLSSYRYFEAAQKQFMFYNFDCVLVFNDTSTLVGHFVSSPREREKRDRKDSRRYEREEHERKRNRNEREETEEIKTYPLYLYLLQG